MTDNECYGCGDPIDPSSTLSYHFVFEDGEEFDACFPCTMQYFVDMAEMETTIKSAIKNDKLKK